MKKLLLTFALFTFGFLGTGLSYADYGNPCQPVYGGGYGGAGNCLTAENILLNKTVLNPKTNKYVDNMGVNDPRFLPGQKITFQLTVKNIGMSAIKTVTVRDTFPRVITNVVGAGSFDSKAKTLTFGISDLNPNESKTFTFSGEVVSENQLTSDITCSLNQASANTNDNQLSQDNAQFCIDKTVATTKGGLPVMPAPKMNQTPATGPEMLPLLGLIPAGLGGLFLRRKSSK